MANSMPFLLITLTLSTLLLPPTPITTATVLSTSTVTKDQLPCTMCAECVNPCQPLPQPPLPPPPPPPPVVECPPPPLPPVVESPPLSPPPSPPAPPPPAVVECPPPPQPSCPGACVTLPALPPPPPAPQCLGNCRPPMPGMTPGITFPYEPAENHGGKLELFAPFGASKSTLISVALLCLLPYYLFIYVHFN